jgi:uroporphyrinogen III methyltransferase/synthase
MKPPVGKCYLVGAGPGDPGLVTVRARELIETADVVVYDQLVSPEIMSWIRPDAERHYVGKKSRDHSLPQEEINALIVRLAFEGKNVVRLKGGDPYIFGRGGEEALELREEGIEFEVVPGVTSATAAAAYAGIPLTHRDHVSCVTFLTGHEDPTKAESRIDWQALVASKATLAIYMGMENLSRITKALTDAGMPAETAVAVIQSGTTPRHRSVQGTLVTICNEVATAGLGAPAMVVVGSVVSLKDDLDWFEKKPLRGQRIVVTRSRTQASRLRRLLEEQGAEVLELPTIRIEPEAKAEKALHAWAVPDWLVFTSPNGVDHFFEAFCRNRDLRELGNCKIATVGPATAEQVRKLKLKVDFHPKAFTAADLISEWPDLRPKGTVLHPCGNLVEDDLEKAFQQRGWKLQRLVVYRTELETEDETGVRARLQEEGADWIVFSSASTFVNFEKLGLDLGGAKLKVATLGPVTSEAVRAGGWQVDLEASASKLEVLVHELVGKTVPVKKD